MTTSPNGTGQSTSAGPILRTITAEHWNPPAPSLRSIPYRLSDALGAEVPRHQVVDLSAPGQQLTESRAILLADSDSIRPSPG